MAKIGLKFVKTVTAKGKQYHYFDTGERIQGKAVLRRLPDTGHPDFGTKYGAYLAVRTKRDNRTKVLTFKELATAYQQSPKFKNRSDGTKRTYIFYLVRMIEMFDDWPAMDIDRADIRALLEQLTSGAQKMQLLVARNIFKFGMAHDKVEVDPTTGIVIEHETSPHDPWPEALIERALVSDLKLPVALLYFTGQRIGDVCKMRWSDIEDGVVDVVQQKTRTQLYIPVHPRLAEILADTPRSLTTIICSANGKPISADALRHRIQKWAGPGIVPHGLRKNAVNALLEAGCTVAEVASITGQSLQMVEHYAAKRNNRKLAKGAMAKWAK